MTNPCSAEAEETADVPDEEYKELSIRQNCLTFFSIKSRDKKFAIILSIRTVTQYLALESLQIIWCSKESL
jgi:hypothetical protein